MSFVQNVRLGGETLKQAAYFLTLRQCPDSHHFIPDLRIYSDKARCIKTPCSHFSFLLYSCSSLPLLSLLISINYLACVQKAKYIANGKPYYSKRSINCVILYKNHNSTSAPLYMTKKIQPVIYGDTLTSCDLLAFVLLTRSELVLELNVVQRLCQSNPV